MKDALSLAHHKEKDKTIAPLFSSPDTIFWYLQVYPWEIQRSHSHCAAVNFAGVGHMVELIVERSPWDHYVYLSYTHFDLCSPPVQCLAHLVPQTASYE